MKPGKILLLAGAAVSLALGRHRLPRSDARGCHSVFGNPARTSSLCGGFSRR